MDIREQKQALRKKIRQEMQPLPPSYFQQAGKAICQKIITTDAYPAERNRILIPS